MPSNIDFLLQILSLFLIARLKDVFPEKIGALRNKLKVLFQCLGKLSMAQEKNINIRKIVRSKSIRKVPNLNEVINKLPN